MALGITGASPQRASGITGSLACPASAISTPYRLMGCPQEMRYCPDYSMT
jgi:hypothetical protein